MIFDDRDGSEDEEEVRISTRKQKEREATRLEKEAEDELVENSGSSAPGSSLPSSTEVTDTSGSGDLEKVVSQNEEIISLLREIKSEVTEEEEAETTGGAPADQLL